MLTVLDLLENYKESLKEGRLTPVPIKGDQASVGQIRELTTIPEERFLVLEEVKKDLFLTVPMTSYLQLIYGDYPLPKVYELRGLRLSPVPTWDYLRRDLIENYSYVIGKISDLTEIKVWLNEIKNAKLPWYTRKFLKLNAKVWSKLSLSSILTKLEEEEKEPSSWVIRLSPDVEERIKEVTVSTLAAETKYKKGENFYAVVEKESLKLYLPLEFVGKRIRISYEGIVLFEGEVESPVLEIEGDFRGIKVEELNVVEL